MAAESRPPNAGQERLHKHLARLGVGSRREIEGWIEQGRVTVDGRAARLGDQVGAASCIALDGRPLPTNHAPPPARRVIIYHKPEGQITTRSDPQNRPTVFQYLPKLKSGRWVAVGRLDLNTRGLLLFTTDGELANRLMHPSFGVEREYLCRIYGAVDAGAIARLKAGVKSGREVFRFQRVRRLRAAADDADANANSDAGGAGNSRNVWYSAVIGAGKYREVRRAWEAVGGRVSRLIRVRYGHVILPKDLRPGQWRELPPDAVAKLLQSTAPATAAKDKTE